ncbi:hypothetical protein AJ79_06859 [Helicocarpus griseus UAMH5409]|uniref:Rhamnogalacturonase A/B/Epimerase-like pectate lyase domain-containing protein n=1 Tax=Helicocarpus griseus UAMH5409 TaxID=1447875 RepID=A0A2B7X9C4_9EURO|nr:hypothetical protein AJ79_06859 [Helicocarpus griseus UAMH5409]
MKLYNLLIAAAACVAASESRSILRSRDAEPGKGRDALKFPASTLTPSSQKYWYEEIEKQGTSPFLEGGEDFKIYRNVQDYGASGNGSDATAAIQAAIDDGGRCGGGNCGGYTGRQAIVYIPGGTYLISDTIRLHVGTELRGDPLNMPVLKAESALDPLVRGFDPELVPTTTFMISIRNIIFDSTSVDPKSSMRLLDWAVSQTSTLINCVFNMPDSSEHVGVAQEGEPDTSNEGGGSPIIVSDLTFHGGRVGLLLNAQQCTLKGIRFVGCATGLEVKSVFAATFHGLEFDTCGTGVNMTKEDSVKGGVSFVDCSSTNSDVAIDAMFTGHGAGSAIIDNFANDEDKVTFQAGDIRLTGDVESYVMGNQYVDNSNDPFVNNFVSSEINITRPRALVERNGKYLVKAQPTYDQYNVSSFASVKDAGAKGDGRTDDTAAINKALQDNADCKITFFPHGVYIVTDTIVVPPGSRIVGEFMSMISGSGPNFGDIDHPRPVVQVGQKGDIGLSEMTDMLITIAEILPGAILLEVNMAGANPGDVSFHTTHLFIGGIAGSEVNQKCGTSPVDCKAGFMHMHLTNTSQAYIENMWAWTADHSLDGAGASGFIGTGRGILIEAIKGSWLMGVSPEHTDLYGTNIANAENVYNSFSQFETAYWQPWEPHPWTPNAAYHDPDFSNCDGDDNPQCRMGWPLRVSGSKGFMLYGTGFWAFFNTWDGSNYTGNCPGKYCQLNAVEVTNRTEGSYLFNINTKQIQNLVWGPGTDGSAQVLAEQAHNPGSWPAAGGILAAYLGFSD